MPFSFSTQRETQQQTDSRGTKGSKKKMEDRVDRGKEGTESTEKKTTFQNYSNNKKKAGFIQSFRDACKILRDRRKNYRRKVKQRHGEEDNLTPRQRRAKLLAELRTLEGKRNVNSDKFLKKLVKQTDQKPDISIFPKIETNLNEQVKYLEDHEMWVAKTPTILASIAKNFVLSPNLRGALIMKQEQWKKEKDKSEDILVVHDVVSEFSVQEILPLTFTYQDLRPRKEKYSHYFLSPKNQEAKEWIVGMLRNHELDKLLFNLGQAIGVDDLIVWGLSFFMAGARQNYGKFNLHIDGIDEQEDKFYIAAIPLEVLDGCSPELLLFNQNKNGEIVEGFQYKYDNKEMIIFPQSKYHMTANTEHAIYSDENELRTILFLSLASKNVDTKRYGGQAFLTMVPCFPYPTHVYGADPEEWIGSKEDKEKEEWNKVWEEHINNWPECFDNSKDKFHAWAKEWAKHEKKESQPTKRKRSQQCA